jgi:hypothetical protein
MKKFTFLFLMSISLTVFGQDFIDVTGALPQLSFGFSAWGDFDGDGDLDLYYAGQLNASSNGGGLYQNDNGTFTLLTNSGLPMWNLGAADWGDVDGDGDLDIAIMGYDGNTSLADVFINNGNNTFTAANAGLAQVYSGDLQFADINGDGHLDIGITGVDLANGVDLAKLYLGDGNGNFTELTAANLPPINYGHIKFADYDNDGDVDFVLSGWNDSTNLAYTKIWANDGNANFTEQSLNLPQLWLGDDEWGDVDNDGDLDLVLTGTSNVDSEAHLMLNNNGIFTDDPHFNIDGAHRVANIELADFDNDGSLDIFITGANVVGSSETLIAKIYNNNGSGVFSENTNISNLAAVQYGDADAGDYDNDGKVDLFVTGVDVNYFGVGKLYHNGPVVSVENVLNDKFNIYPNPATDFISINNKDNLTYQASLNDLTGKTVYANQANTDIKINVSNLPAGMYLLKITSDKNTLVKKVVVK